MSLSVIIYVDVFPVGFKNLFLSDKWQSGLSTNIALYNVKNVLNTGKLIKLDFATILVGKRTQFITASFKVVWLATSILAFSLSISPFLIITKF